jgi:hypothetical protein
MKIRWRDQSGKPAACGATLPIAGKDKRRSRKLASRQLRKNRNKCRQKDGWITGRCPKRAKMITIPSLRAQRSRNRPISRYQRGSNCPCALSRPSAAGNCRQGEGPHGPMEHCLRIGRNMIIGAVFLLLPSSSGRVACTQRTPLPEPAPAVPGVYDPFRAMSLADGAGLRKQFAANDAVPSSARGTLTCWGEPSVEREARSSTSHNQQHGVKTDA